MYACVSLDVLAWRIALLKHGVCAEMKQENLRKESKQQEQKKSANVLVAERFDKDLAREFEWEEQRKRIEEAEQRRLREEEAKDLAERVSATESESVEEVEAERVERAEEDDIIEKERSEELQTDSTWESSEGGGRKEDSDINMNEPDQGPHSSEASVTDDDSEIDVAKRSSSEGVDW